MKKVIWMWSMLAAITVIVSAQPHADSLWMRSFYCAGAAQFGTARCMPDSGYVIVGSDHPSDGGDVKLLMARTNAQGDTVWARVRTDLPDNEWGYAMDLTRDGGIIVAGVIMSWTDSTLGPGWVVKTDGNGDTLWCRSLSRSSNSCELYTVTETTNGDYVAAGVHYESVSAYYPAIVRITSSGDSVWHRTLPAVGETNGITKTSDNGVIATGYTDSDVNYHSHMTLTKLDSAGQIVWDHVDSVGYSTGNAVQPTRDGGFIAVGQTYTADSAWLYIARLSQDGQTLWTRRYDGLGLFGMGTDICQASDSGFMVVGSLRLNGSMIPHGLLLYVDDIGNPLWYWSFGVLGSDAAPTIRSTPDGGFIVGGSAVVNGTVQALFLLRMSPITDVISNHRPSITAHTPQALTDTVAQNATVHFSVTATDPDGDSLRYVWTRNGSQIGTNFTVDIEFPDTGRDDIKCVVSDGQLADSLTWSIVVRLPDTAEETRSALPTSYALHAAYPNPFNPSATIPFDLPQSGRTTLKVYDLLGRVVATLAEGPLSAGYHTARFDAGQLPSGVYIYRLSVGHFTESRKMVVLK